MRTKLQVAASTLALLGLSVGTLATAIERLSIEKMASIAQTIVRARCVSTATRWENGEIWTVASFEVQETWKGVEVRQADVHLLGGTVDGLTSNVSGVPRFRAGEEVILFLEPTRHGSVTVVGWQQGTLRIRRDKVAGIETVTQDTAAFETFDPQAKTFKASGIRDVPLELFRARVEAALAESAGRKW